MNLKKKIKRAYEELTGLTVADINFPTEFNGKNWRVLMKYYSMTKPSQRVRYYKEFRFFVRNIKAEFVYEEKND